MQGKILDWDGVVNTLSIQYYTEPLWTDGMIIFTSTSMALMLVVLLVILVPLLIRYRKISKRKKIFKGIHGFILKRGELSLDTILNDKSVKIIKYTELHINESDRLGSGACGEVLKATWKGKSVAVKRVIISRAFFNDDKALQDLLVEIKLLSVLEHPNILKFLGISSNGGDELLLVTELMERGSVTDVLQSHPHMDFPVRLQLAIDAANGICYLHALEPPVIHRDLKSENLLINNDWMCKIADFGISTMKSKVAQTMTQVGTPIYMAPEVIKKTRDYSTKVDVYSFGILLIELLTSKRPYSDLDSFKFPSQIMFAVANGLRPDIPDELPWNLRELIRECLSEEPNMRPDFPEILKRLQRAADIWTSETPVGKETPGSKFSIQSSSSSSSFDPYQTPV